MSPLKTLPCGRAAPSKPKGQKVPFGLPKQKSWQNKLDSYLASNELNQSESRNKLMALLLEQTEHFTIQEFIKKVSEKHPAIGTATVYRNIPILVEVGVLKETLTDNSGQKVYELADDDHHDHIVCLDCNHIFEFHDNGIEAAQDRVSQGLRFAPVKHRHVIFAKCEYQPRKKRK